MDTIRTYKTLDVRITGTKPLLVHNVQLANPLNPIVKKIKAYSGKRKKTDEDLIVLNLLEWVGGLYTSQAIEAVHVSGESVTVEGGGRCVLHPEGLKAAIKSAAKKLKLGTTIDSAIMIENDVPIQFNGDNLSIDQLLKREENIDIRAVTVNRAKIMRARPIFFEWQLDFPLLYLPDTISKDQIVEILKIGGQIVGMYEYCPRFGTYKAEVY